jgi:hypothetical protein
MIVNLTRLCEVLEENRRKVVRLLEYGWMRIGDPATRGNLSNQWPFNEFIKGMGSRCASQIWRPKPRKEQETLTGVDHPSTDQAVDPTPTPTDQATDPTPPAQTATARAAKKERHDLRDQLTLFKQRTQALEQQVARLETQNHLLKLRLTVRSLRSEIQARLQVFQRYGAIDSCWAIGIMHHELEDLDRRIQSLKVGLEVGLLHEALSALQNRLRAPVLNRHPEALERERVLMSGEARSGEGIIVDEAVEAPIARLRNTAVVLNADSTLEEELSRLIRESFESHQKCRMI